ncbi:AraC family transcriptional regulator [Aquabacterium sp.]|jgi:AraC-like DNA-binding protein|uniref:AraC family transcriptional regulator n=1 Tax=Aquabacterium sp. TaxID=1872578 RepID=UPI0025BB3437|nr:AraC family transcriptional regulator [Aquabacterium sp.]
MPIDTLAAEISRFAQNDGPLQTAISPLTLYRSSVKTEPLPCVYGLGLAVAVQGAKEVSQGDQVRVYGAGQSLLTTVDLPVVARVVRADLATPFLCMVLTLDARALVQTAAEMKLPPLSRAMPPGAMSLCEVEPRLLDALVRLVRLLDEPDLAPQMAPLVQQEIMVRLLAGPHGPHLRHLVSSGSPSHHVARAMAWLKQHFSEDVRMDELAASVHMSPSTFRHHFRQLAGMSPLQYQKQLRLQEARQLMLNQALDAGSAAARVGYESAPQFSREYSRLFGEPPQRDIRRLRDQAESGVAELG